MDLKFKSTYSLIACFIALLVTSCSTQFNNEINDVGRLTEEYFQALNDNEVSRIPFAEDVEFFGPLRPNGIFGKQGVTDFMSRIAAGSNFWDVKNILVDGSNACAEFDLVDTENTDVIVPIAECLEFDDGMIKSITLYFDPRPLMN